jgi:hypothetical protein
MQYPALSFCTVIESRLSSRLKIQLDLTTTALFENVVQAESIGHANQPESDQTARAAAIKAYWSRPLKAGCWWGALSDATTAEVIGHISRGDRRAALAAIDRSGAFLGPILPGTFPLSECE